MPSEKTEAAEAAIRLGARIQHTYRALSATPLPDPGWAWTGKRCLLCGEPYMDPVHPPGVNFVALERSNG